MEDSTYSPVPDLRAPVPVVFIHQHYSFYLEFTLRQARLTNPASPVWLIGDAENNRFPFARHTVITSLLSDDYRRFDTMYTHSSPNCEAYEKFCFQRWFLLRELMHQQQYEVAFMADTDVMLYDQLDRTARRMLHKKCVAAYNVGADCDWVNCASGHSSFWTRAGIDQFCAFILKLYEHPDYMPLLAAIRADDRLNNQWVGISDMTALYLFMKQGPERILNLSRCKHNWTFDHNIGTATNYEHHEYSLDHGYKRVFWIEEKRPVCFNRLRQQPVQMATLHFQGPTKKYIHRHYTGHDLRWLKVLREGRLQATHVYHRLVGLRRQVQQRLADVELLHGLRKSI